MILTATWPPLTRQLQSVCDMMSTLTAYRRSEQRDMERQFLMTIEKYSNIINRICRSFSGREAEFDDLRQDALTNIWTGLQAYRGEADLKSWIYRVTFNTCVSTYRRNKVARLTVSDDKATNLAGENDSRREDSEWLLAAINTLSPENHAIIAMWLDDLKYEEIAKVIGMNKNTVGTRVKRIKEELQKMRTLKNI